MILRLITEEVKTFLVSFTFYTRIPIFGKIPYSDVRLNKATKYFPLIGLIIAGILSVVYFLLSYIFPPSINILICMLFSILITGAFHEDGFADSCDGFGGGWDKQSILTIMKDSRVGSYALVGTTILLLFKFIVLLEITKLTPTIANKNIIIPTTLLIAYTLSRFIAASFIFSHNYVQAKDVSKVKPVAQSFTWYEALIALLWPCLPLIFMQNIFFWLLIPINFILKWLLGKYYMKWIGGYTGDALGATQQVSEVFTYLSLYLLWKYI